ncbi:hypothetical protein NDU88_001687 [Pleurodeles waltl]|uniref:SAP domain-containing protein n=1 Tax=Pleurodeles waltl TaxID=8319 RepID=A0AAV7Q9I3_PLEWA|nr:hypothetical protein NDU88_001687 [Pleurodeles waltl]
MRTRGLVADCGTGSEGGSSAWSVPAYGEMDRISVDSLNKAELQKLCKERRLKVGKKASKVGLQKAIRAYEQVKRLQTATEEDDPEGDDRTTGGTALPQGGESGYTG